MARDSVAKLFSRNALLRVSKGDFSLLEDNYALFGQYLLGDKPLIEDFYNAAYYYLLNNYRNEYVFKNTFALRQLLGIHSPNTSTLIPEFRVGVNKADLVFLNGSSVAIEIKTRYDSLSRLASQIESYSKVFEQVCVLADDKHVSELERTLPWEVGIFRLTEKNSLSKIRPSQMLSDERFDCFTALSSLRLHELEALASRLTGQSEFNYNNINGYERLGSVIAEFSAASIKSEYRATLKRCRSINVEPLQQVPFSLKNAVISFKFTKRQFGNLVTFLKVDATRTSYVFSNT